jgi:hypothetical protein
MGREQRGLNLCAAWLALDDCGRARSVAQAAWPQSVVFELQHYAAAYLALLAALELAQAALGEANVSRLRAQGAALRDCDIETLAFGIEDADSERSVAGEQPVLFGHAPACIQLASIPGEDG